MMVMRMVIRQDMMRVVAMGLEYKKVLLQNVIDCSGMGLDNHDEIIKQAIEWTIDDCMNHLNNELNDYVETEEFSKKLEKVI